MKWLLIPLILAGGYVVKVPKSKCGPAYLCTLCGCQPGEECQTVRDAGVRQEMTMIYCFTPDAGTTDGGDKS